MLPNVSMPSAQSFRRPKPLLQQHYPKAGCWDLFYCLNVDLPWLLLEASPSLPQGKETFTVSGETPHPLLFQSDILSHADSNHSVNGKSFAY